MVVESMDEARFERLIEFKLLLDAEGLDKAMHPVVRDKTAGPRGSLRRGWDV